MTRRNFKPANLGIGLLELMLSLAIIAVLLIMATRYYSSASGTQKIQAAVDMVNAVRAAVDNYVAGEGVPASPPSIATLVSAGYLPSTFVTGSGSTASSSTTNPWGSSISTNPNGSNAFEVLVQTPSPEICQTMMDKILATSPSKLVSKDMCAGNNEGELYAVFYYE